MFNLYENLAVKLKNRIYLTFLNYFKNCYLIQVCGSIHQSWTKVAIAFFRPGFHTKTTLPCGVFISLKVSHIIWVPCSGRSSDSSSFIFFYLVVSCIICFALIIFLFSNSGRIHQDTRVQQTITRIRTNRARRLLLNPIPSSQG